jgi:DNA-binding LytR/AlgR family response regulator
MKARSIIVDDEPLAVEALGMLIEKIPTLELVGTCTDAMEAVELLQKQPVDLMFLDIQMPGLTGIDLLKTLLHPPDVILTTAYRHYAVEAFDLNVVDYLVKPISIERLLRAVNKYFSRSIPGSPPISARGSKPLSDHIYLRADKKNVRVKLEEIQYVEGLKDYVKVHCKTRLLITKLSIGKIADLLPELNFLRIHRSYMVNIENISAYSKVGVEIAGRELPIGDQYKSAVENVLNGGPVKNR